MAFVVGLAGAAGVAVVGVVVGRAEVVGVVGAVVDAVVGRTEVAGAAGRMGEAERDFVLVEPAQPVVIRIAAATNPAISLTGVVFRVFMSDLAQTGGETPGHCPPPGRSSSGRPARPQREPRSVGLECLCPHAVQADYSSLVGAPAHGPSRAIDLNRESQATTINAVQSTADDELLTFTNAGIVTDADVSAYGGLAIIEMVLYSLEAGSLDETHHGGRGEHHSREMRSRHLSRHRMSRLVRDAYDQRLFHPRILAS
jgi:hypothetical protein